MWQGSSSRMASINTKVAAFLLAAAIAAGTAGCAGGSVSRWLVDLRSSQGDTALASGNVAEALGEYDLALRLDPKNAHARAAYTKVVAPRARARRRDSKPMA